MFETAAIPTGASSQRIWSIGMGLAGQTILAACAIAIPLLSPAVLPKVQTLFAILEAPAPPLPKPEHVDIPTSVVRVPPPLMKDGVLREPASTPTEVKYIEDPPLPVGMSLDSAIQSVERLSEFATTAGPRTVLPPPVAPRVMDTPPEPAPAAAPRRIKVGGVVVAAVPIRRVEPVYPQIAINARISGKVELEAVIGTDGRIHELKTLSGSPLLIPAAIEAVRQWFYKPYMLNGDPVEVVQAIIVTFKLK